MQKKKNRESMARSSRHFPAGGNRLPHPFSVTVTLLLFPSLQTLTDYACMYIKYLQIYNKLEESYDQVISAKSILTRSHGCSRFLVKTLGCILHFLTDIERASYHRSKHILKALP